MIRIRNKVPKQCSCYTYWNIGTAGSIVSSLELSNGECWNGKICIPFAASELETGTVVSTPAGKICELTGLKPFTTDSYREFEVGSIYNSSVQSLKYADPDLFPRLSTGLTEKPCHHWDIEADISTGDIDQISHPSYKTFSSHGSEESGYNQGYHTLIEVSGTFVNNALLDGVVSIAQGSAYSKWFSTYYKYYVTAGQGITRQAWRNAGDLGWKEASYEKRFYFYLDDPTKFAYYYPTVVKSTWESFSYSERAGFFTGSSHEITKKEIEDLVGHIFRSYGNQCSLLGLQEYSNALYSKLDLRGGLDINMIENLSSLNITQISNLPKLFKKLHRQVRTVKEFVELGTSLYLGKKYGLDNTIRDLQEAFSYIKENGCSLLRNNKSVFYGANTRSIASGTLTTKTKLVLQPRASYPDGKLVQVTDVLGLELTPAQLWDCVPFSFAVDWIVQVGDLLAMMDQRSLCLTRFQPVYIQYSAKIVQDINPARVAQFIPKGASVNLIRYKEYDRCNSTVLAPIPSGPETENHLPAHVIEAGCLVLNKLATNKH